jgi:multisubunit Na+/H+ antiporter MnhB subunit
VKFLFVGGVILVVAVWARLLAYKKRRRNPAIAFGFGAAVLIVVGLVAAVIRLWGM